MDRSRAILGVLSTARRCVDEWTNKSWSQQSLMLLAREGRVAKQQYGVIRSLEEHQIVVKRPRATTARLLPHCQRPLYQS